MTTFQAVIYALSHSISEFFPIGSRAHQIIVPYLMGWQLPKDALLGALSSGSLLALLIYFRHDWASMISCFLQVLIYRKRPMTLDERLPLFISLTSIPLALGSAYFSERAAEIIKTPLGVAAVFALTGTALGLCERMGRKNKGMFDWNWKDATLVGLIQAGAIFPGWDHLSSAILGALFLNYRREPAVKYAYFASAPILLGQSIRHLTEINFHSPVAAADLSWLSFGVAWIVSLLAGLLVIGGLMKHIQHKGMGQYVAYRWILSVGVALAFWLKST